MDYKYLMYAHLITVVPCFFYGRAARIRKKGIAFDKLLVKIFISLMMITAIITLFIPAEVGPQFFNYFGYIHLFSFLTLCSVPTAIIAIKKGQVEKV